MVVLHARHLRVFSVLSVLLSVFLLLLLGSTVAVPRTHRNMLQYEVGQELGFGSLGRPVGVEDDGVDTSAPSVSPEIVSKLRREASEGKTESQYFLGVLMYYGEGVPQDLAAAVDMFRRAANGGNVVAMTNLGLILTGAPPPDGADPVSTDEKGAVAWFSRAATMGDAEAQWMLGRMKYDAGVDHADAFRLFSSSAKQGNANGQFYKALSLEYGLGHPQDFKQAADMYKKAGDQGHLEAQYNLGLMYASGRGREMSYSRALLMFERAAQQEHGPSCIMLATMHIYGRGVPTDYVSAKEWFRRALASNDPRVLDTAQKGVDELTDLLRRADENVNATTKAKQDRYGGKPQRLETVKIPRTQAQVDRQRKVAMAVADAQARQKAGVGRPGDEKNHKGGRESDEL